MITIKTPTQVAERLTNFIEAWEELAADKVFGGMTLEQFQVAVKPSFETRDEVRDLTLRLADAVNRRMDADARSTPKFQLAVNSVKGDPAFGDDSSLYEAAGYVRRSEKRSGLSRKAKTAQVTQKAA